jgi:hypothetical protein
MDRRRRRTKRAKAMNWNAVATMGVPPTELLRPPRPADGLLSPTSRVPGAPFPFAVASSVVTPARSLRPPRPARGSVIPKHRVPGALFPNAVARCTMTPTTSLRPPRPGLFATDAQKRSARAHP